MFDDVGIRKSLRTLPWINLHTKKLLIWTYTLFSNYFLFFNFEIIRDLHSCVKNYTEILYIHFTQFFWKEISYETTVKYPSKDIDIDKVKMQNISVLIRVPLLPFRGHTHFSLPFHLYLYPWQPLVCFSFLYVFNLSMWYKWNHTV